MDKKKYLRPNIELLSLNVYGGLMSGVNINAGSPIHGVLDPGDDMDDPEDNDPTGY